MSRSERRKRERKGAGATAPSNTASEARRVDEGLRFTKWTGIYLVAGVITAVVGFVLLAREQINLAPVFLLVAFLVFFPLAVVK